MKISRYVLLGFLCLLLALVECFVADLEVKGTPHLEPKSFIASNAGSNLNEQKGRSDGGLNSIRGFSTIKNDEEKVEKQVKVIENDWEKGNSSKPLGSKEGPKEGLHDKAGDGEKESKRQVDSKIELKEKGNGESLKKKSWVDECDSSNMCADHEKNLTACLIVPANNSPDLSLLIQNKGTRTITI